MVEVVCPKCGEDDRLQGKRQGKVIQLICEACHHLWLRDAEPRCLACGASGEDLSYRPKPLFSKGRGTMRTPTGQRASWDCDKCGHSDCTTPRP